MEWNGWMRYSRWEANTWITQGTDTLSWILIQCYTSWDGMVWNGMGGCDTVDGRLVTWITQGTRTKLVPDNSCCYSEIEACHTVGKQVVFLSDHGESFTRIIPKVQCKLFLR